MVLACNGMEPGCHRLRWRRRKRTTPNVPMTPASYSGLIGRVMKPSRTDLPARENRCGQIRTFGGEAEQLGQRFETTFPGVMRFDVAAPGRPQLRTERF